MSLEDSYDSDKEHVHTNEENVSNTSDSQVAVLEGEGVEVDDEIDEEAIVEGAVESAVQIAPTENMNPSLVKEDDPMLFIQLGDRIIIDSRRDGRVFGTVYYYNENQMNVKPDGLSNRVMTYDMNEEGFDESIGVEQVLIIEKRKFESFVEQQDFRVNNRIDTFDSDGQLYKEYRISKVNQETDSIDLEDENEEIHTILFEFIGIPLDESFNVISIRQPVGEEVIHEEQPMESNEWEDEQEMKMQEEEVEEEDEIVELGLVSITKPKVIREATSFEQRIPDTIQKIDALDDFISNIDSTLQKDPKAIRAIRVLVETLFYLKQDIIAYNEDGTIRGLAPTSVSYLSDLVEQVNVPMGRPVLRIAKKIYAEEEDIEEKNTQEVYVTNFNEELTNILQGNKNVVSEIESKSKKTYFFWNDMKQSLKKYVTPWRSSDDIQPIWSAHQDSDVFRYVYPEFEQEEDGTTNSFLLKLQGYLASHSRKVPPILGQIPFGMERTFSTTYRKGTQRTTDILFPKETASLQDYLLYPSRFIPYLGSTRSNFLATDSGRGQLPKKTMKTIYLDTLHNTYHTTNDILLLTQTGNKVGNILLEDYVDGMTIPALGIGDTFSFLLQYGLSTIELTPPILTILQHKISAYQSQLKSSINHLRTMIRKNISAEPKINYVLKHPAIIEEIRNQPILADALAEWERIHPILSQSDVALFAYLLRVYPDYVQVAASNHSVLIAAARWDATNKQYAESLRITKQMNYNTSQAGQRPERNHCQHVNDLVAVQRIKDGKEQFEKRIEWLVRYQGEVEENWINCKLCKKHLLCKHERQQIEAFIRPAETATIQKELILKFAGGQFQGHYICRNCGQSIREIDFDNNIEFDDNGKPKSGRSVLVDEDAIRIEQLENKVNVPAEQSLQQEMKLTDDERSIYDITRIIVEHAGVTPLHQAGYRFIIDNVSRYIASLLSEATYKRQKEKNPKLPSYLTYKQIRTLCSIVVYLLIELQTSIPSNRIITPRIGCDSPGLQGYPLHEEKTNKQGIEYLACVIASIRRKDAPWTETGYQDEPDDKKRQLRIIATMDSILEKTLEDSTIQAKLREKRVYLTEIYGAESQSGKLKDSIPSTFLPQQIMITPEEAAKDVIIPEVIANMNGKARIGLITLWIRQSHILANKSAKLVRDSQYLNTTCCLTNITTPTFWKESGLPDIGKRSFLPSYSGTVLIPSFVPREVSSMVAEPNKDLYFRIFLTCCFTGPRVGHPHEPGLDNLCPWCGFQFPTNLSIMDTDHEGKAALATQQITTDSNAFTTLLDKIHLVNQVEPFSKKGLSSVDQIMASFASIQPAPVPNWKEMIDSTYIKFKNLPADADVGDIAMAAGDISEIVRPVKDYVEKTLRYKNIDTNTLHKNLKNITKLSWSDFLRVIQSYFIVPFERKLVNYNPKHLFVPKELSKELTEDHVENKIKPMLELEMEVLHLRQEDLKQPKYAFAYSKLSDFVHVLSGFLPFKQTISIHRIPHGKRAFEYIQQLILYGSIASLLNPQRGASNEQPRRLNDSSESLLIEIVAATILKYDAQNILYDDKKIKELIEIRNAKERATILDKLNNMTEEERQIELMKKRLRMGDWAIGGKIHVYDGDIYEIEAQQRRDMGISDFPASELPPDFGQVDDRHVPAQEEDGYDHRQQFDDE
jgi:hypothetical protein